MNTPLTFPIRADYFAAAKRTDPKALALSLKEHVAHLKHWRATGQAKCVALTPDYNR